MCMPWFRTAGKSSEETRRQKKIKSDACWNVLQISNGDWKKSECKQFGKNGEACLLHKEKVEVFENSISSQEFRDKTTEALRLIEDRADESLKP